MLFNSAAFAVLVALSAVVYWATPWQRARLVVLLVASLTFYGWRHWPSVGLLLVSIGANYALGRLLERTRDGRLLALGVGLNVAALAWFKYAPFVAHTLRSAALELAGLSLPEASFDPWLPLGISFFTFQVIAYQVDVWRGEIPAERSILVFAVFKSYFAQLVAGPIVRATELLPQLQEKRTFEPDHLHRGALLVISGWFLKEGVADVLAQFADRAFAAPAQQTTVMAWLSLYAYSVQLFCDFWGYSTMAVGVSLLFGIRLPVNFRAPYLATSLRDFWRRWHITLSSWLRDYVYVPLGGNRRQTVRNLLVVMAIGGLWHGASWSFVLWGLCHGAWLAAERLARPDLSQTRLGRTLGTVLVFHGVALLWVLFRAPTLEVAAQYYGKLLLPPYSVGSSVPTMLVVWLALFGVLHSRLDQVMSRDDLDGWRVRSQVALSAAMLWLVLAYGGARLDFIYFVF